MAKETSLSINPTANFLRLTRLLMREGVQLLRETLDAIHSPADLPLILANPVILAQLKGAGLTLREWACLYPSSGVYGKSKNFGITLIFKLFKTICSRTPPPGPRGWDNLPNRSDHTLEADLVRIKYYRNEIYGHRHTMEIADIDFIHLWDEISEALLRIATNIGPAKREKWEKSIDDLLRNPLTPDDERCIEELEIWYKGEMDVEDELEKLREDLREELIEEVRSKQPVVVEEGKPAIEEIFDDESTTVESPMLKRGRRGLAPGKVINVNNYFNRTVNMAGHVCVAGKDPSLNVQAPSSAVQRTSFYDMAEEALQSTRRKANFHRLTRLLMRGGEQLLRETLDSIHSPADLPLRLADPAIQVQLKGAGLTRPERACLYPSTGVYGKSKDFDITLIFKLFRTICSLTPPPAPRGWDNLPNRSDHTLVADLIRIKYYRNEIYGHRPTMEIADIDFTSLWEEIREALLRIATNISPSKRDIWKKSIDDLLRNPLTPDDERCIEELETWYKGDFEDELEKLREELREELIEEVRSEQPVVVAEDCKGAAASKIVTSNGASLSVKGVTLIFPPGAVKDPVTIQLTLDEPYKYCYRLIARCGLQNDVIFVAPIVNCQPNGQKFENYITVKVTLNGKRVKSHGDLLVLHGTRNSQSQKPNWEDITDETKFDLETKELKVKINHFSLIAVLARLYTHSWVCTKEFVTRLTSMSFNYELSVLLRSNQQQCPSDELALVFMSQDTYQEEYYRDHDDCALMRLKKDGFEELPIDCRNLQENNCICNKETLKISIQLGEDYKLANNQQKCFEVVVDSAAWWKAGHVIKLPLQASDVNSKIFCGKIRVEGKCGHDRKSKFCQQDLCGYVRHVLAVKRAIFDVKSVAQKLELPVETQHQVVACWQGEKEQLELAVQHWEEKHGYAANPNNLKKALEELEPEEYKVKERGQLHIELLRDLAIKITQLRHKDSDQMKSFANEVKKLCKSVLIDCCIESATSKGEMESAILMRNFVSVLGMKKRLPDGVAKTCTSMFSSQEDEFITTSFLRIVSELIQAIKEIFREEKIQRTPSGLRGVTEEATLQKITSGIQGAAHDKNIFKLLNEVCDILEILCRNNNYDDRQEESRIQRWVNGVMMGDMLDFLERFFQSTEARRLYKRLELFSVSIKDIMLNNTDYEGSLLCGFHNVAVSLLKFAKFDPSHLVQFELKDPTNSINNQTRDDIKYDMSKETFSQLFWMIKESEEILQLEATAHVHIGGHLLTIGAFEAVIVLPESRSEVVENAPITSFPVSFKSETDGDSGNLQVTLYSTQKDDISKALEYLQNALSGHLIFSEQTEIKETSLKLVNVARAGTDVRLRLIHRWGSGTIEVESNSFEPQPLGYSSPESQQNLEITDESDQPAVRESSLLSGTSECFADNYNSGSNFMTGSSSAELIPFPPSTTMPTVINVNNYFNHTVNMEGHVCVAGDNPSLNVQAPSSAVQRFLEAGPGAATNRSITAGANEVNR